MLISTGIPTKEDLQGVTPSAERLAKGPVAIAECFQKIPCNPCVAACAQKAISMGEDINQCPVIDFDSCTGCGVCLTRCPGLAIFIVDETYSDTTAVVRLPFEYLPLPQAGQYAMGLNRSGEELGWFKVVKVIKGSPRNLTHTIWLEVPKQLSMEVRNIREGGYRDE